MSARVALLGVFFFRLEGGDPDQDAADEIPHSYVQELASNGTTTDRR